MKEESKDQLNGHQKTQQKSGYLSSFFGGSQWSSKKNEEEEGSKGRERKSEEAKEGERYDLRNSQMLKHQMQLRDHQKAAMRERQEGNNSDDTDSNRKGHGQYILEQGELPTIILPQMAHRIRG